MSDSDKKPASRLSLHLLEQARRCWKKQQQAQKEMEKKGIVLCPGCRAVMVQKGTLCALCEFRKKMKETRKHG